MDTIFDNEYLAYLEPCRTVAREAGALIMTYFNREFITRQKDDKSPVTDADVKANQLIVKHLKVLTPHIPIIAEEDETLSAGGHAAFWLVDPLDGTRSFVRGEPEFTVNIGLIHNHRPVLGVIYAPPQETMYWGMQNHGAFKQVADSAPISIKTRTPSPEGLVVVRSKSHPSPATAAYLETLRVKEMIEGSSSIKFCQVAEGSADIYPRFGRTMEWDTAAGHAILSAAGGRVDTSTGEPLLYGKPGFENPHFIAFGF